VERADVGGHAVGAGRGAHDIVFAWRRAHHVLSGQPAERGRAMKTWTTILASPLAMLASQALAENWVDVARDDDRKISIDKDSIRRGSDGLVNFTYRVVYFAWDDGDDTSLDQAADCQRRVLYQFGDGTHVEPDSQGDTVLQYVCANAE
jgi:hypothetical protein